MEINLLELQKKLKPTRTNDENLATVMMRMLDSYGLKEKYNETRMKSIWGQIMGEGVARQTSRLQVEHGVLYISLRSAALRQELSYLREQIKSRLNDALHDDFIKEVRLY
jgi:predicted nucleic acid-binding Zn ribbon protein